MLKIELFGVDRIVMNVTQQLYEETVYVRMIVPIIECSIEFTG